MCQRGDRDVGRSVGGTLTLRDATRAGCGPVGLVLVVVEPLPHLAQKCNLFCAVAEASGVWCVVCGVWCSVLTVFLSAAIVRT